MVCLIVSIVGRLLSRNHVLPYQTESNDTQSGDSCSTFCTHYDFQSTLPHPTNLTV